MGILEESKVAQVINRLEDTRSLLNDINAVDNRFNDKIAKMLQTITEYERDLGNIKEQLNVENLGVKVKSSPF
jgi:hypothetical protein